MVIFNRVLLALTLSYMSEEMCKCALIPQDENDICKDTNNPFSMPPRNNFNFSRSVIRVKREPPAPTVAYYDFLVNEFSFKVWAVFEVVTIALLFYSTFAAIYYARWTYLRQDFTDEPEFLRRSHERLIRSLQTQW